MTHNARLGSRKWRFVIVLSRRFTVAVDTMVIFCEICSVEESPTETALPLQLALIIFEGAHALEVALAVLQAE